MPKSFEHRIHRLIALMLVVLFMVMTSACSVTPLPSVTIMPNAAVVGLIAAQIERMESRNGIHAVKTAATLRLGSREYEIVSID